ncbi:protein TolR [Allorhizobium taibaishanense]|uniref:Protein TolR n=1 Tax=Allorhizobium taibaishanense TaxID=887144 RepID=A0A1Q9A502_9HYPH|nr:protein TolR [Allorhizobium taibaishanense]MBB4006643.1 biopolymer transport protein TolR [Allorhizobium taibaishanense]OLP49557.1 protein TolR [Allorhizobium taibaishanense]
MGMSVGANGGGGGRRGGRRRGGGKRGPVSEINVTPLVDVMLVLLIIFMVAAPMMTVGVPIDLPETKASAMNSDTQPITISVNPAGEIYLQESPIAIDEVVPKLQAIATTGYNERIYVRGDTAAAYGTVMKVMARISSAGYKNIGLVTLQEQDK